MHMQPEIVFGDYVHIEVGGDPITVPADSAIDVIQELVVKGNNFEVFPCPDSYGARMSAPGYLDATDWTVWDSLEDAAHYLLDTYFDLPISHMEDAVFEAYAELCQDAGGKYVDELIVEYMARTLFVAAYADFIERDSEDTAGLPAAGPCEDWMNVAPATTDEARLAAQDLAAAFRELNGKTLAELWEEAKNLDPEEHLKPPTIEDFGHYLAMGALGPGVCWEDDHPSISHIYPDFEFNIFSRDDCFDKGL